MAYADPPTKTTSDSISNADLNTYLSGNLTWLAAPGACTLRRTAGISTYTIDPSTFTAINFDEGSDTGMHDPVTNNTRVTPTEEGVYLVMGSVALAADGTGVRQALLRQNGTIYRTQRSMATASALFDSVAHVADVLYFNGTTDYVELVGWQSSGSTLHIRNSGHYPNTWLSVIRLGRSTATTQAFNFPLGSMFPGSALGGTDIWNLGVRANMQRLASRAVARAYLSANEPVGTATWHAINWDGASPETHTSMWDAGTPRRLTLPADGVYLVLSNIVFTSSATGLRGIRFDINGSYGGSVSWEKPPTGSVWGGNHLTPISGAAGDYVECLVYQNTGGDLDVFTDAGLRSSFSMIFLGDLWGEW